MIKDIATNALTKNIQIKIEKIIIEELIITSKLDRPETAYFISFAIVLIIILLFQKV